MVRNPFRSKLSIILALTRKAKDTDSVALINVSAVAAPSDGVQGSNYIKNIDSPDQRAQRTQSKEDEKAVFQSSGTQS